MSGLPEIALARVYDPPGQGDGIRLLVDRLWPRGVARTALAHDAWLRDIAPSDALRRWFHADPSRGAAFREHYRAELDASPEAVARALEWCRRGPVTLLYAARERELNHARVLREYLIERLALPAGAPSTGVPRDDG